MTTEKLIELAKACRCCATRAIEENHCKDCPYKGKLLCQDLLLLDVSKQLIEICEELKGDDKNE